MNLYSYIVAVDAGFAPNPVGGFCSVACCKPKIRKGAEVGDWIMGTTSTKMGKGKLIYLMQVNEIVDWQTYSSDPRFSIKKPSNYNPNGDNIYKFVPPNFFTLIPNPHHVQDDMEKDTRTNRILLGTEFYYFGSEAPQIPVQFLGLVHQHVGQKKHPDSDIVRNFISWVRASFKSGILGTPHGK